MDETSCTICGEAMFIGVDGVACHGVVDEIDYNLDADHVAINAREYEYMVDALTVA